MQTTRLNGYIADKYTTIGSFVEWSVASMRYATRVPAGLRVRYLPDPSGGRYVLDEFPELIFPLGSFVRHDAEHYGVPLSIDDLGPRS